MKTIKFSVRTRYVGCDYWEEIKFKDDITEEEIECEFKQWVWENIDAHWEEVKK